MSMVHDNIQKANKLFVVVCVFLCSVLIFPLKMSTLHGNIPKTKNISFGLWMFPCSMLILMVT